MPELSAAAKARMVRQFKRAGREKVPATNELVRILELPRRVWEEDPQLSWFTKMATKYLKLPQGTQELWPVQAKALQELHDMQGLYGPIPAGKGKTLVTFLAPVVLEAERPLLVVPAKLRDKTIREFAALGQHWKQHAGMQIISYEKLSRVNGTAFLQNYRPDLLIFDESHRLKNTSAAVTRKVEHYMEAFPKTTALSATGTSTKRSLLDFAHTMRWSLPKYYPLPRSPEELGVWASVVDEIKVHENRVPGDPGALLKLCNALEKSKGREGVRTALRRRIHETPGVVSCEMDEVEHADTSINIELSLEAGYGQEVRRLVDGLREGYLPNGDVYFVEGNERQALSTRWRIMRTLTSGFWYDWDPKPPQPWMELRSQWRKAVRRVIEERIPGLESEALIARAAAAGKINQAMQDLYLRWRAVRGDHKWNTVPVWVDDSIIERVAKWVKNRRGIVWVSEVALGQRLEQELGLPYFHRMGKDRLGRYIESWESRNGSVVASVQANGEGRNLQYQWSDNLVISPPPTGTVWEQLIARTHRTGQEAEEVWVEVVIGCRVEWECWRQAMRDAWYASQIEGKKRLTLATIDQKFQLPAGDGGLW
jgi:hypothetical protein